MSEPGRNFHRRSSFLHSLLKPLEFNKGLCIHKRDKIDFVEAITMSQQKMTLVSIAALLILYAGNAGAADEMVPAVPDDLKVPANQMLSIEARGTGVQIYECRENKTDPAKIEWVFKSPEAKLYDSSNRRIGKHYAGPTWESTDGSKVVGELRVLHKSPENNAIPWLLLRAKSHSGSGVFSSIESIQRLKTIGGNAPAEGCSKDRLGKEIRVPYKALYYFYVGKP
jgi:hypothetical protein